MTLFYQYYYIHTRGKLKFLQNFVSSRDRPEKSTKTRHEMKERKKSLTFEKNTQQI